MLSKIKALYVFAVVIMNVYMTRAAWMSPHRNDLFDLAGSVMWGFVYAFFAPGIALNLLLGGARSTPLILGGSFAFWLLMKRLGKNRRPRQASGTSGVLVTPRPQPAWESWSRESTHYIEEER